ncbi:hypothetical protein J6590_043742 [Homalodisca vitripennis]|nr:hypothetical protein J6590_043742 [Homalodisca vitripennis]
MSLCLSQYESQLRLPTEHLKLTDRDSQLPDIRREEVIFSIDAPPASISDVRREEVIFSIDAPPAVRCQSACLSMSRNLDYLPNICN